MSVARLLQSYGNRFLPTLLQSQFAISVAPKISCLSPVVPKIFGIRLMHFTKPLGTETYFTESHEWIQVDGNTGVVGITDHAQDKLGDIVYCELPEVDDSFEKNEAFGTVESVKAASDLCLPMSGKILEKNGAVVDSPGIINEKAENDGWLVKIELSDLSEADELMSADQYQEMVKEDKN